MPEEVKISSDMPGEKLEIVQKKLFQIQKIK